MIYNQELMKKIFNLKEKMQKEEKIEIEELMEMANNIYLKYLETQNVQEERNRFFIEADKLQKKNNLLIKKLKNKNYEVNEQKKIIQQLTEKIEKLKEKE